MDYKSKASGEMDETLPRNENRNVNQDSTKYVLEVIEFLETFTGKQLSVSETVHWKDRLLTYPKWKLLKLHEYTGGLNNDVFKYLDGLIQEPQSLPRLPEPPQSSYKQQVGLELYAGIRKIMADDSIEVGKHKEAIKKLHADMRKKHPKFASQFEL